MTVGRAICVCGEKLKFIRDPCLAYAGCGDLRCIKCGRTSGYCTSMSAAEREFEHIYNHNVRSPTSIRLIDANALMQKLTINCDGERIPEVDCDNFPRTINIREVKDLIRNCPTIIL